MSTVSIILLAIPCIIVLLLITALFSKKTYLVERSIHIDQPREEVFGYVRMLKNQDHYHKWVMEDPLKKKKFRGNDGTKGFIYEWDGNNKAGAGEQEITSVIEGRSIETEVRFKRPFTGIATSIMKTSSVPHSANLQKSTEVRWAFSSRLPYPMNIMLLIINLERKLGADLDTSLQNLKTILEAAPVNRIQI